MTSLFTPRTPLGNPWNAPPGQDPYRIAVQIEGRPRDLFRKLRDNPTTWHQLDTDHGIMLTRGAPCEADCYCDAVAIPADTPPHAIAKLDHLFPPPEETQ